MISLQFLLFSDTTHRLQKILKAEFLEPEHVILLADEEAVQRRGDRAEHRALAAEEAQDEVERAQLLVLGLPRADGHAHVLTGLVTSSAAGRVPTAAAGASSRRGSELGDTGWR